MNQKCRKTIYCLLAGSIILGGIVTYNTGKDAAGIRHEIHAMRESVDTFRQKAMMVNQSPYRPVTMAQAADVQRRILAKAEACSLSIQDIHEMPREENGLAYEMTASGTWKGTARFLQDFHVNDALLSIRFLSLGVEQGNVRMIMGYKIYTKHR